MYVRVQIVQGIDPDALAVPQQAVRRNNAGGSEIFVVRDDNRASLVQVRLGHAIDDRWLILDGAKPGDRVIVDGFQKFADGDVVDSEIWREAGKRSAFAIGRRRAEDVTELKVAIDARFFYRPPGLRLGRRPSASASAASLAIPFLAVAQYPIIAPPSISITTSYPGASPENLYNSVTRLIEEELNGANGILNFESTSDSLGQVEITANFVPGTDTSDRFGRGAEPHQAR